MFILHLKFKVFILIKFKVIKLIIIVKFIVIKLIIIIIKFKIIINNIKYNYIK